MAAGVALGLAGVLAVSGAIEAFVTPSSLPTWARIAIGVAAEVAFCLYVFSSWADARTNRVTAATPAVQCWPTNCPAAASAGRRRTPGLAWVPQAEATFWPNALTGPRVP